MSVARWIVEMAPALLAVTAFNPVTRRAKLLAPEELSDILRLMLDLEAGAPGAVARLAELGLDPDWYHGAGRKTRPLFMARAGDFERTGYSLKDLLPVLREFARLSAGLDDGGILAAPGDKLVFVVDDDDPVRDMLSFVLRREGFRVDVFADGVELLEGLDKHQAQAPDLIILDLMLPRQSGFEVARALQARAFKAPLMVITGRHLDQTTTETLRSEPNVADFLPKPIRPGELAGSVHRLLRTRGPEAPATKS